MNENDSLYTLPFPVINQLGERVKDQPDKYKPSYIARILNRAVAPEFHNPNALFLRGHFFVEPPERFSNFKDGDAFNFTSGDRELVLDGMTYPGLTHGKKLFELIDQKVMNLHPEWLPEDQLYFLAAFLTICSVTIHPFRDSNGRGAVGLADVFLRTNMDTTFDYEQLVANNEQLVNLLIFGSVGLLPISHHPDVRFAQRNDQNQKRIEVKIPHIHRSEISEIQKFLEDYAESISRFITTFSLAKIDAKPQSIFDPYYSVQKLAALYKQVEKPADAQQRVQEIQAAIKAKLLADNAE